MMRLRSGLVTLGLVALTGSILAAQEPARGGGQRAAAPPEPHNLKVLPASTTTAQILPPMRSFAAALGTNCGYCHVWTSAGDPSNDYAADTKTPKLVARVMMQMVNDINQRLAANIKKPADQITQVQCMTCHRGEAIPKLPPPPARGAGGGGAGAGGATPPPGR